MVVEGPKGTSKYVPRTVRAEVSLDQSPYGGQPVAALLVVQWLESLRQRNDLELVLNRLVRTRMPGGVGGVPGNRAPIPIHMVLAFSALVIH